MSFINIQPVFLGSDNSVKLGDFGLSKLMQSHDFASTYVGTPFYMSPEICAAEPYTLHSDIWALGCIMYELCQKAPPFNAKTHIQLVQRIREGKYPPLPDMYSSELKGVIASCLRVNPDQRPDTASLLNLPVVRLVRKEREIVDMTTRVKRREEAALQKMKDLEIRMANYEKDKALTREEIDAALRREWEVKARLEIERQVQMRYEELSRQFETEVRARVAAELEKVNKTRVPASEFIHPREASGSTSCSEDSDFPSTTDISDLSLESPSSSRNKPMQKVSRTPFSRAKTTVESPMDIQMGEPSPITIASLSLSPRRTAPISKNLFTEQAQQKSKWEPSLLGSDDEEDIPDLPSPTRPKVKPDPFKAARRPMLRHQTTAMVSKMSNQPSIFPAGASRLPPPPAIANPVSTQQQQAQEMARPLSAELRSKSPTRRLSKIPSTSNLIGDATSPTRKGAAGKAATFHATKVNPSSNSSSSDDNSMYKAVMQRNMGGRTLVELAQARAGGRVLMDDAKRVSSDSRAYTTSSSSSGSGLSSFGKSTELPATWDPNSEQMPSPFVSRRVFHSFR